MLRTRSDAVKAFIADLARPFAIYATSGAAAWGIVVVSYRVNDGNDGAFYIAAALTGVGAIYIGKAVEVFKSNRAAADVEVARASASSPPGADLEASSPEETPPWERGQ